MSVQLLHGWASIYSHVKLDSSDHRRSLLLSTGATVSILRQISCLPKRSYHQWHGRFGRLGETWRLSTWRQSPFPTSEASCFGIEKGVILGMDVMEKFGFSTLGRTSQKKICLINPWSILQGITDSHFWTWKAYLSINLQISDIPQKVVGLISIYLVASNLNCQHWNKPSRKSMLMVIS